MDPSLVRLCKLMAQKGLCSRREADALIERGWVLVDGQVIDQLGAKVPPNANIILKEQAKEKQQKKLTFLLHKPVGYVSCQPEKNYPSAIELINSKNRDLTYKSSIKVPSYLPKLAVAGRLDIDSKGLLVITQDGRVAKTLIGPDSKIEKEYIVRTHENPQKEQIQKLKHGLSLDGKALKPAQITLTAPQCLKFILQEGKKRQIRRMCELVGLQVTSLKRVRIGKIDLGNLKPGHWRVLEAGEYF